MLRGIAGTASPGEIATGLPAVSVRIDRTSNMGSPYSSTIRAGMLSVVGQSAFVTAHWGRGGRWTANLATGQVAEPNPPAGWMSFSKWSLVMDDGDEEITLVSYDAGQAS